MSKRQETQEAHRAQVLKVLAFIRLHSQTALTLSELATIVYQSPFYFERVFQEQTGLTVMQHVRQFRLVKAAVLLRLSKRKIVDIALESGYANHESFSRAFRTYFGYSPSQYRKQTSATSNIKKGVKMQKITIGLVKIPITDFEKATHYYREIVGLEEEFAVDAYGWAQYKTGNLPLCLYKVGQGGGDGVPGEEVGFHLVVEDIRAFHEDIKARGGQFGSGIVSSDDGGMFFVLRDPDNNSFKIIQRVT